MKQIPLTQGQVAFVDDEDFERINKHKWCARWDDHTRSYRALRGATTQPRKQQTIYMHREVVNAPKGFQVDHINHDTLDNRRGNLRICSTRQNMANQGMVSTNTSGFKGVSWDKKENKWRAAIRVNGKSVCIGMYITAEHAAVSYDREAEKNFGKFALTNQKLGLLTK